MRTLTSDELISETLHRLRLRGVVCNLGLVELVAEMIEIARHPVVEGYSQASVETGPTAPLRR